MWPAIVMAIISAVSAVAQSESNRRQKNYEADVARKNAIAKRQEAELEKKKTANELRLKDKEKNDVRRKYKSAAGINRSMLAAGNVDITSGAAFDMLAGNYNRFADDMGELEYQKEQIRWGGEREYDLLNWEADSYDNRASFLKRSAGTLAGSVLTAGLAGTSSYISEGGTFGGGRKETELTGSSAAYYKKYGRH